MGTNMEPNCSAAISVSISSGAFHCEFRGKLIQTKKSSGRSAVRCAPKRHLTPMNAGRHSVYLPGMT